MPHTQKRRGLVLLLILLLTLSAAAQQQPQQQVPVQRSGARREAGDSSQCAFERRQHRDASGFRFEQIAEAALTRQPLDAGRQALLEGTPLRKARIPVDDQESRVRRAQDTGQRVLELATGQQ